MKVLVIGGGGREHALAWRCAQSAQVERVYVAPGNGGTAREPKLENVPLAATDLEGLVAFARREGIALTLVGPEQPLVAGVVDRFDAAGLACFGPSAAAAQLEGSKAFSKAFMARHGIPTARHRSFEDATAAHAYLEEVGAPVVVKADGLAAGKGVVVAHDLSEAHQAVTDMLGGRFGTAGARVVIEDFLAGEEASFIVMVGRGGAILPMATSQDHKTRDDGDRGPNTGGMGAYSPAPVVTPAMHERVMDTIIRPTVAGLAADGIAYMGFLYAGLMIGPDGTPRVLEYNCRFGDPEAQPVMMRLRSDLAALCLAAVEGRLDQMQAQWDPRPALGVVMAAAGYPGEVRRGDVITGISAAAELGAQVFHAATRVDGEEILTDGGRVLCVCALGDDLAQAQALAYRGVKTIHWPGVHYRSDIGHRALAGR
ncbi:MAG TPA: phosphoribosylamine--glycine ligase [Candidatus Macondimonas sp.]|nr:phosphoribosylamine--glycine ligase [Candidatus Macondimonas sp.]